MTTVSSSTIILNITNKTTSSTSRMTIKTSKVYYATI